MLYKTTIPQDSFSDLPSLTHSEPMLPPMAEETWPSEVENAPQTDLDKGDNTLFSM
jgi:hypothetical protein